MCRVLVADDDEMQRELRKEMLEISGHDVLLARCASEALAHLENAAADVILMDLRFPNARGNPDAREGLGLIRRIRERGCRTPVIVLSGWPDEIYGTPEEEMVSRVVMKPVRSAALLELIAEVAG